MQEKLFFESSKGHKLCGMLSAVEDKERPIIALCHGFTSSKNSNTNTELERILNENNISTFRFDLFAHGESEGKQEDLTTTEAVDDVLSAIRILKDRGYKKIGLVGSSFGGITSIMAASKTDDLFVLALKCPVSNFEDLAFGHVTKELINDWKEKGYVEYQLHCGVNIKLNYAFFEDLKGNNGYEAAKSINVPTLIVHGDKDQIVPIDQSKKTCELIKNCKLEVIPGADHDFKDSDHFNKMIGFISGFIIEKS